MDDLGDPLFDPVAAAVQERRRQRKAQGQSGHDRCLEILHDLRGEMEEMSFDTYTATGSTVADACSRMLQVMTTLVINHERVADPSAARRRESYEAVRAIDQRAWRANERIEGLHVSSRADLSDRVRAALEAELLEHMEGGLVVPPPIDPNEQVKRLPFDPASLPVGIPEHLLAALEKGAERGSHAAPMVVTNAEVAASLEAEAEADHVVVHHDDLCIWPTGPCDMGCGTEPPEDLCPERP